MKATFKLYLRVPKCKYFNHSRSITMQAEEQDSQQKIHSVLQPKALHIAEQCLRRGEVIALPTDTVYGLACVANNEEAIQKLYNIKGRHCEKPVAICVKDLAAFRRYAEAEHINDALLERLLPGPITIVVERSKHLNNRFLNPTTTKIGIRIPDFNFIQQLCAMCKQPLALTSANRSNDMSSLNIHEFKGLWPQLGGIFDAGQVGLTEERRSASTVIDLAVPGRYGILREGVALKTTLEIMLDFGLKPLDRG